MGLHFENPKFLKATVAAAAFGFFAYNAFEDHKAYTATKTQFDEMTENVYRAIHPGETLPESRRDEFVSVITKMSVDTSLVPSLLELDAAFVKCGYTKNLLAASNLEENILLKTRKEQIKNRENTLMWGAGSLVSFLGVLGLLGVRRRSAVEESFAKYYGRMKGDNPFSGQFGGDASKFAEVVEKRRKEDASREQDAKTADEKQKNVVSFRGEEGPQEKVS